MVELAVVALEVVLDRDLPVRVRSRRDGGGGSASASTSSPFSATTAGRSPSASASGGASGVRVRRTRTAPRCPTGTGSEPEPVRVEVRARPCCAARRAGCRRARRSRRGRGTGSCRALCGSFTRIVPRWRQTFRKRAQLARRGRAPRTTGRPPTCVGKRLPGPSSSPRCPAYCQERRKICSRSARGDRRVDVPAVGERLVRARYPRGGPWAGLSSQSRYAKASFAD